MDQDKRRKPNKIDYKDMNRHGLSKNDGGSRQQTAEKVAEPDAVPPQVEQPQ